MHLCKSPLTVPGVAFAVDCGHCRSCRLKKKSEWIMRLSHEADYWRSVGKPDILFVLLTYDREHLPEDRGLSVRDLQLFNKRLRKSLPKGVRYKYFAAGEYGRNGTLRPHYHILFFGLDMSYRDKIYKAWSKCLDDDRTFGCRLVTSAEAYGYAAGYASKKLCAGYCRSFRNIHKKKPEFHVSSLGLGRYFVDCNPHLSETGVYRHQGRERLLPRYYRKLLGVTYDVIKPWLERRRRELHEQIIKIYRLPVSKAYEIGKISADAVRIPAAIMSSMRAQRDMYLATLEDAYMRRGRKHNLPVFCC